MQVLYYAVEEDHQKTVPNKKIQRH